MKKAMMKVSGVIASYALLVTTLSVNVACICFLHQPKLPEGARKLRKF